jgi:hypothetical protein
MFGVPVGGLPQAADLLGGPDMVPQVGQSAADRGGGALQRRTLLVDRCPDLADSGAWIVPKSMNCVRGVIHSLV